MNKTLLQKCAEYCQDFKLLYVEDNEDIRLYTAETLKRFCPNVTTATDGIDGLEKFKKETFDVVLTDINMPNMNGLEMTKEIRKIRKSVPILVLSAYNETEYFLESIKIGVDGFILKPLDLMQLIESLYKAGEKVHLRKELKIYQDSLETKVQQRTQEIEYNLYHDDLTGLLNHKAMLQDIDKVKQHLLFLIDIKGFQKVNDVYGLKNGDLILQEFSKKLSKFDMNQTYSIYRAYGDGFVLYHTADKLDDAFYDNEKHTLLTYLSSIEIYLDIIEEYIHIELTVSASVNEVDSFIKAETALRYAKKNNENFVCFTPEIDNAEEIAQNLQWQKRIKIAIEDDNIIPVFQGIVDNNQHVVKYESLMRLREYRDAKEELISPYFFLEIAKNTQQYDKLTTIMIFKVFEKMQKEKVDFSINLSSEDLINIAQMKFLQDAIIKFDVGSRLVVEILESEVIDDYKKIMDSLNNLKKYGVRIAIDDFGSGFSNFEHLLELRPDYIKIDASLIKNIVTDKSSYILVKAISQFSKELGMKVIAEFVSSKEIFDILQELDIDEYQGFYFSMPSVDLMSDF
jgi:diguanylate cyclase (GGDEF)-like protein